MGVPEEDARQKARESAADEPIFDLDAQSEDLLDPKAVLFSIYNETRPEEKKTKQEEEWRLRMTCTQEWFIRCSWINKYLFLEILCFSTRGCTVLENALKSVESILSKDVLESLSGESTSYHYDKIPADDNRALEPVELNRAMQDDFYWFLNLEASYQTRVIQRLLRLGGGGLVFRVYQLMEKIYRERQGISRVMSGLAGSVASRRWEGSKQKVKEGSKTGVSVQSSDVRSLESEGSAAASFHVRKLKQLARRDAELSKYKKLKGISLEESKTSKKGEARETVDYLQILPIWLNRRIMSYIDDKSLSGFKKVGKYWGKMIDESINEKSGRKAINAKINKMVGIRADKEEKKIEEKSQSEEVEFITELGAKELINKKNESEERSSAQWCPKYLRRLPPFRVETSDITAFKRAYTAYTLAITSSARRPRLEGEYKALNNLSEWYEVVFSKKCIVKTLDSSFYPERCGAYDSAIGFLACSTASNVVQFYSVKTGARLNFLVFGFESPITCLALHENRIHMFFGCKDGSLVSKDIRTNKTAAAFNGHTKAIISIFTTESNLLSASMDNTIKYFQLWSGLCLLCIDLSPEFNVSTVLFRNTKPSWAAIGTMEGTLVMVDIEAKKFLVKARVHAEEITRLTHDGDILVTGSARGKIRVWDVNRLGENSTLRPFFNIEVGTQVSALRLFKSQIFCGCENGTMKIISLATGKIFKTLKISSQTPVTGLDITEDKLFMKLIIWHEKGIEIRTFSLQKSSPSKMSMAKDNQENKQKAPKETQANKTSEMVLAGYVKNSRGLIEVTPNVYKRTTFGGIKKPLEDRCCTLFALRGDRKKAQQLTSDAFTRAFNDAHPNSRTDIFLQTFPRFKKSSPQHPTNQFTF